MEIEPQKVLLIVAAASRAKTRRSMEAEQRSEAWVLGLSSLWCLVTFFERLLKPRPKADL